MEKPGRHNTVAAQFYPQAQRIPGRVAAIRISQYTYTSLQALLYYAVSYVLSGVAKIGRGSLCWNDSRVRLLEDTGAGGKEWEGEEDFVCNLGT